MRRLILAATLGATALALRAPMQAQARPPVTFSEHVAPIVFANCSTCHRPGEAAPFALLSYRDARPLAKAMAVATASRAMPPWKVADDYPFHDARGLTDAQIATLQQWAADGAPEGDTAPVTREVLRQFEADPQRRPRVHVG